MFVGRTQELEVIENQLQVRDQAQLIVIYGRRRIGKSRLIMEALKMKKKTLFFEGIEGENTSFQIDQFLDDLSRQTGKIKLAAKNWREVFQGLEEIICKGEWFIVFDEFPWMAVLRSTLVAQLKPFWDRWSLKNPKVNLFLCGSVSSFMIQNIVHSRALHNRKTLEICLKPLTPKQSGEFMAKRSVIEKAKLYMTLGGIPKYLEQILPSFSYEININKLCFVESGFFINEYETLFKEQFKVIKTYQKLTEELARSPDSISGLARKTKLAKGGGLQNHLENLVKAQFVKEFIPVSFNGEKRTRTKIYKLVDPFLKFYFTYMHENLGQIRRNSQMENLFKSITNRSLENYFGLAFERLCDASILTILEKLNLTLADIEQMGPYFRQRNDVTKGVQVDYVLIRRDGVITLIENKFTQKPIGLNAIHEMEEKVLTVQKLAPIFSIEKVLISARGVTSQVLKREYFNHILTLEDLYA